MLRSTWSFLTRIVYVSFKQCPASSGSRLATRLGHAILYAEDSWTEVLPLIESGKTWCRDGSSDPTEFQANRFASYLLVPTDRLLRVLPTSPWSGWSPIYRLAETFGITPTAMIVRLEQGQLAHRDDAGKPASGPRARDLAGQETLPGI